MDKNKNSSASFGIGFPGLLALLFIGLKLTGYVSWSWFWVLSPLWISFGIAVIIIFGVLILTALARR